MINEYSALESNNPEIVRFAVALRDSGIEEGFDTYYVDEDSSEPFFKIPKPYKWEREGDPDYHYIYVDICEKSDAVEYRITMIYTPIYVSSLDDCIALCKGLYDERFCEVALVTPIGLASGFAIHRGSHEKNVKILIDDAENIINHLKSMAEGRLLYSGNVQMMSNNGLLLDTLAYRNADSFQYKGITVYAASYL